jgi:uncharacterized protein (TIGR02266 family)
MFLARSCRVITASDGAEALAAARREQPDVVVTELDLPGSDGEALCKEIKANRELRDTPVIIVTSATRAEDRRRAIYAGADDVLIKPVNHISVIQAVSRFLRFPVVRTLPRVRIETPVRIRFEDAEVSGIARDISRGGILAEAERTATPGTEVELRFRLPDTPHPLSPTATVKWRRENLPDAPSGMGLEFLAMDGPSVRCIDEFVYERAPSREWPRES